MAGMPSNQRKSVVRQYQSLPAVMIELDGLSILKSVRSGMLQAVEAHTGGMRQSLVTIAVVLLLCAAATTAQQNTLDSVVQQTTPLVTGEYKQQISAALPGVLRKAADARAAGDTSVEALSNAFSSLEELTGAPLSAKNRQAVIDGINRVYSASFVQPPPEAPAPAAPKRPQQQGGQASSVSDSKKGSVAAGVASIVVPAMVGSLGFLALLCCGLCFMRKKWKKQEEEEVLPEAHPSSKKLPEGTNGRNRGALAESVSTDSYHVAAEFNLSAFYRQAQTMFSNSAAAAAPPVGGPGHGPHIVAPYHTSIAITGVPSPPAGPPTAQGARPGIGSKIRVQGYKRPPKPHH
eukprot:gene10646-10804_t